jgi:hypothetical protein
MMHLLLSGAGGIAASLRARSRTQVLVSADADLIEPTVISMGKVLRQRELELPLNGRNFSQLHRRMPLDAAVGAAKITHHNGSKNW